MCSTGWGRAEDPSLRVTQNFARFESWIAGHKPDLTAVCKGLAKLRWAFADFDTASVEVDRQTLSPEGRQQLVDLLKHRPLQFCLF